MKNPKPDPEIYLTAAARLGVEPGACLVIEDSPVGVRAGVAAGMKVIAVPNHLTEAGFRDLDVLDARWVAHDPSTLMEVAERRMGED